MAGPTPYSPLRNTDPDRLARDMGGVEVTERPMTAADARQFGQKPTIGQRVGEVAGRLRQTATDTVGQLRGGGAPVTPTVAPSMPGVEVTERAMTRPEARAFGQDRAYNAGRAVRSALNNPVLRGAGKLVGAADAIDQGTQAVDAFQAGDNLTGGYRALRAGADVAATRGNLPAAAFAVGSGVGDVIYNNLGEGTQNRIGSAVNSAVRGAGRLLGQDWGVDDTALRTGAMPTASSATSSAQPTAVRAAQVTANTPDAAAVQTAQGDTPEILAQRSEANTLRMNEQADQLRAERLAEEARNAPGQEAQRNMNIDAGAAYDRERARQAAETTASSIDPRSAARGAAALKGLDVRDLAAQNNEAGLRKAVMDRDTTQRGQDITATTLRRGQDLELTGRMSDAAARRAQLQYQVGKDERDFAAGRSDANFTQRQAARKAADERIDAYATDPSTGKVDPARANQRKEFLNNGIAMAMEQARAAGDTETYNRLKGRTYADLDPEDEKAISLRQRAMEQNASSASAVMPFTGTPQRSNRPQDWTPVGIRKNTFGSNEVEYAGGGTARINDLRNTGVLNMFKPTSTEFDDIIRQAEEAQARKDAQLRR